MVSLFLSKLCQVYSRLFQLEILQRLRDNKVSMECLDAMRCLFECCSPLQFDETAVSVLVDMVITLIKDSVDDNQFNRCHKLIKLLKVFFSLFHTFLHYYDEKFLDCTLETIILELIFP